MNGSKWCSNGPQENRGQKQKRETAEQQTEKSQAEIAALKEHVEYLEGKLEILKKNMASQKEAYEAGTQTLLEERARMLVMLEEAKLQARALKEEIRQSDALVERGKRRRVVNTPVPEKDEISEKEGKKEAGEHKHTDTEANAVCKGDRKNQTSDLPGYIISPASLPLDWILSNLNPDAPSSAGLLLLPLNHSKLKKIGRFLKKEFDSIYRPEVVLRELRARAKKPGELIKCLVYLSDRPEIVSELLPYFFKRHLIPEGPAYISDIVKILEKTGVNFLLSQQDTTEEMRQFFETCCDSDDLLFFLVSLSGKAPTAAARVVTEKYLENTAARNPDAVLHILEAIEGTNVSVQTEGARRIVHASSLGHSKYACKNEDLHFYM